MNEIAIPSTAKQIQAQKILKEYRETMLGSSLQNAVAQIPPKTLHQEIVCYVPDEGMQKLQSLGIREEVVFALPCVLKRNPRLLGYYRLLMGISEKQFYTVSSGLSSFRAMEHEGRIEPRSDEDVIGLCQAINGAMNVFLGAASDDSLKIDLNDLPLMTLGVYVDGVWRNIIGQQATLHVFNAIKTIVKEIVDCVTRDEEKRICFKGANDCRYGIFLGSDPDISVTENDDRKILCIEIKGGQDVANVHNRAGEAEKSHQKATQEGWREKWTLIYLSGLQEEQRNKLSTESPSTDRWFDINEVCAQSGQSYQDFKAAIISKLRA